MTLLGGGGGWRLWFPKPLQNYKFFQGGFEYSPVRHLNYHPTLPNWLTHPKNALKSPLHITSKHNPHVTYFTLQGLMTVIYSRTLSIVQKNPLYMPLFCVRNKLQFFINWCWVLRCWRSTKIDLLLFVRNL